MNTPPILVVAFNRPQSLRELFTRLQASPPAPLFIAIDGPREANAMDTENVTECIQVARSLEWPCPVQLLLQDKNLGCGAAVSAAISWFFENVNEGIILEDDLLPSGEFFQLMADGLETYRDDPRVLSIGGYNAAPLNASRLAGQVRFSRYPQVWGWATWRNRWDAYDFRLPRRSGLSEFAEILRWSNFSVVEALYWFRQFHRVRKDRVDTWDYQLTYLAMRSRTLSLVPNVTLVENRGWGEASTHTRTRPSFARSPDTETRAVIQDKLTVTADNEADAWMSAHVFRSSARGFLRRVREQN